MTQTSHAHHVLPPEQFTGEFTIGTDRVPITLTACAGPSGRLELDVEPISTSIYPSGVRALLQLVDGSWYTFREFGFDCKTAGGKRLKSDTAYLVGHNLNSRGLNVTLRTRQASLKMMSSESRDQPELRFWLLGFECFPAVDATSGLGSVVARGATQATGTDEITGCIAVKGPPDSELSAWRESAEHMLKHLRSVLAFARASPLPMPVAEFYYGDGVEATFYQTGGGHAPETPPMSHLNLEDIVVTAVTNIETVDAYREVFEMAIGWFVVRTTVDEIRLLSGMTALESLTSRSPDKSPTSTVRSSEFRKFSKTVKKLVAEYTGFDDANKKAITAKIPDLNRHRSSTRDKIEALLNQWNIPRTSIGSDVLRELIVLRNEVVHTGSAPKNKDLWPSILFVREILVRLVLSMLKYEGTYQCYIDGIHMRRFPDCTPVD